MPIATLEIKIVQNATAPNLQLTLRREDGTTPPPLATAQQVRFIIQNPQTQQHTNDGHNVCAIVDANTGVVRYDWQAGDIPVVGFYTAKVEIDYGNNKIEKSLCLIEVTPDI